MWQRKLSNGGVAQMKSVFAKASKMVVHIHLLPHGSVVYRCTAFARMKGLVRFQAEPQKAH